MDPIRLTLAVLLCGLQALPLFGYQENEVDFEGPQRMRYKRDVDKRMSDKILFGKRLYLNEDDVDKRPAYGGKMPVGSIYGGNGPSGKRQYALPDDGRRYSLENIMARENRKFLFGKRGPNDDDADDMERERRRMVMFGKRPADDEKRRVVYFGKRYDEDKEDDKRKMVYFGKRREGAENEEPLDAEKRRMVYFGKRPFGSSIHVWGKEGAENTDTGAEPAPANIEAQ